MRHSRVVSVGLIVSLLVGCAVGEYRNAHAARHLSGTSLAGGAPVGPFTATVSVGPDTGMSLTGELTLQTTNTGERRLLLVPQHSRTIPISGQRSGLAMNLVFYLPGDRQLFGVGTIGEDPATRKWVMGGPLAGPRRGDTGAWEGQLFNASGFNDEHQYKYSTDAG